MALGKEVGLGPSHIVLDGDTAIRRTQGTPTTRHFLAHFYCGQTAEWMNMPLRTEVDLGPGHFVLDGFPAIGERGTAAPSFRFGPCLLWPRSPISATAELLFISLRLSCLPVNFSFRA